MKKWSLEDDSDEETPVVQNNSKEAKEEGVKEEVEEVKEEVKDEEEIDPLDAFMAEVNVVEIYM